MLCYSLSSYSNRNGEEVLRMKEEKGSLLEDLARWTGCQYLSDLHQPDKRKEILKAAEKLDISKYSLGEWEDAIMYIAEQPCSFNDAEGVREYLQKEAE